MTSHYRASLCFAALVAASSSCTHNWGAYEPRGIGEGPPPCDTVYAGHCGTNCANDSQCAPGLFCAAGQCTADCAPGARSCLAGYDCTINGRCIGNGTDAGSDVMTPDGFVGDACADVTVQLDRAPPTLMLLIDQSASMNDPFGSTSRWNAIRRTLVDPTNGVVHSLDADVRFGLAMYSARNQMQCPLLSPNPPIAPNTGNYNAIAMAMNNAMPVLYTPTGDGVRAVTPILASDTAPGIHAIVLATDGEPGPCSDLDASRSTGSRLDAARQDSVDAVRAAFTMGIRTYVISVGDGAADSHMQALADAGAGASGARFYRALDSAALTSAFSEITSGVRSCTFTVHGTIDPTGASQGDVRLDGMPLGYGDPNGWRLVGNNQIELVGSACMQAQTTASTLSARFPCGIATPG